MRATCLYLLVALTAAVSARASGQQAVPTTDLNFRSGPGRTYQVLAVVGPTDTLTLLSLTRRNHYYDVRTADGNQGWVWDGGITVSAAESGAAVAWLDSLQTWDKPEPLESSSGTCSPYGRGTIVDSATDLRKNRVDTATVYHAVPFAAVLALAWQGLPTRRFNWSARDSTSVARYEGVPIAVEGYLGGSREEGKEATNCGIDTHAWHDWHLWLVETADAGTSADRTRAIVVEVTPRVRAAHPEWLLQDLNALHRNGTLVRISGWLMLDPDHPDQAGKTRGTIWEIHPVTGIEVSRNGAWVPIGGAQ